MEIVRDEHERRPEAVAQLAKRVLDSGLRGLVERRGWLVEEQHGGLERKHPSEHDSLLLPYRERVGPALGKAGIEPREAQATAHVGAAIREPRPIKHVVGHRALQQRRELRDEADIVAQPEHI